MARVFHSLLVPITRDSGQVIPVTMPTCTPVAIRTGASMNVPLAACLPLAPPDTSEVTASFFATGEFAEDVFIKRCAFLSAGGHDELPFYVDVDELVGVGSAGSVEPAEAEQSEAAQPAPAVTVAAATAGSQITATPKLPGQHDDTLTVSDDVPASAGAHALAAQAAEPAKSRGFLSCFACRH